MTKITRESLAATAKARYMKQYGDVNWAHSNPTRDERTARVRALPDDPTPDQVDAAIGNNGWTAVPRCTECGECKDSVIVFDPGDEESSPCYVCGMCLIKSLNVMEGD